jgi:hypothetical protein
MDYAAELTELIVQRVATEWKARGLRIEELEAQVRVLKREIEKRSTS